ncbi:hypothetical protein LguiA_003728 [Lonicera macranthoides]
MDSDDDFYSTSPLKESSPPVQLRKLKRLKKTIRVSNEHEVKIKSVDDLLSFPSVDLAKPVELESSKSLGTADSNEELQSQSPSEGFDGENCRFDSGVDENRKETRRDLEFEGKPVDRRAEMEEEMANLETGETIRVSNGIKMKSVDDLLLLPPVDFAKLEELESLKSRAIEDSNEELESQSASEGFDTENHRLDPGFDDDRKETRRALEFGDEADNEFEGKGVDQSVEMEEEMVDLETENANKRLGFEDRSEGVEKKTMKLESDKFYKKGTDEGVLDSKIDGKGVGQSEAMEEEKIGKFDKKKSNEGGLNEKKVKKKRAKSIRDNAKPKDSSSNKRREEKERKANLQQLHAESQRLLRETRDAAFKPVPIVQKPISSILEKIRKRKLEVSMKVASMAESSDCAIREVIMDHMSENGSIKERPVDKLAKVLDAETVAGHEDVISGSQTSHENALKEFETQSIHEKAPSPIAPDEETTPAFRPPLDDTQDLFTGSQTSDSKDELPSDQHEDPTEEVLAPSLLTMNLKFDSAPLDDMSCDEEDNDKENIEPDPHRVENGRSSPKGDPVKAFVDDEAVEEDDSDNDLFHFQENEEDGFEDSEELNDMIATGYEEQPIDNDKRNELHQKWLEQQDAAGTDNLLQRLNYGSKFRDENLLDEEEGEGEGDGDGNEEECSNEAEDEAPRKLARINYRKAKEMIAQTFFDKKDDAYLSDDEETKKRQTEKQLCLLDKEEKATLLSPAEDENSREVFGLIKKLNVVSDTKKSKTSSFFDTLLTGGNSNSSSRSSFLGRASNHALPSSRKKGSSTTRSFIFGRDDSNSRSSISTTEDSLQTIPKESQPARSTTTKFSNSQAKLSTQSKRNGTTETASGTTSLFEILKRSSGQSSFCKQDNDMVGLTQFAAFKLPKKPVRMGGRT